MPSPCPTRPPGGPSARPCSCTGNEAPLGLTPRGPGRYLTPAMRHSRVAAIVAAFSLGLAGGAVAKPHRHLTFVRESGGACRRAGRALANFERRAQASCGQTDGCSANALRRHGRLADAAVDHCVALNQIQVLGTHNSYHIRAKDPLWSALLAFSSIFLELEYTHQPLDEQFSQQGVRQVEIDVFADPQGGLYARRDAQRALGIVEPTPPELLQPGFKVLHLQDIDFETICLTFKDCLADVKTWSDTHPGHLPIMILV